MKEKLFIIVTTILLIILMISVIYAIEIALGSLYFMITLSC